MHWFSPDFLAFATNNMTMARDLRFRVVRLAVHVLSVRYIPCDAIFALSEGVLLANVNSCSCSLLCRRPSVCLSYVTLVHPTQPIEIFGNVFAPSNTLVTWGHPGKILILRRSSQGNPSGEGLNQRWAANYSDFGPFQGYTSETVQDRS